MSELNYSKNLDGIPEPFLKYSCQGQDTEKKIDATAKNSDINDLLFLMILILLFSSDTA